ncbi:HEPN domain-containing protein [Bifidobacterium samirii]|uniref:HEPN domain-containing protein n=1 Tax=Bifidobacterium samirii TaxID=2306974 RepID=UPI000F7F902E|nr:MAE_28990/MAE_18760 family HEPN-like nuclease [Bifidobacterium samirii]
MESIENDFHHRMSCIRDLINATHPNADLSDESPRISPTVQKSVRGLVIVMLFGAYEKTVKSLCQELIETASTFRGKQKNLTMPFRLIGIFNQINALRDQSIKRSTIWERTLPDLLGRIEGDASLLCNTWPDNGEYMKRSQLKLFCRVFNLSQALQQLGPINDKLDMIVVERNQIAHGELTAEEVGRRYSETEIRSLVDEWETRWTSFFDISLIDCG